MVISLLWCWSLKTSTIIITYTFILFHLKSCRYHSAPISWNLSNRNLYSLLRTRNQKWTGFVRHQLLTTFNDFHHQLLVFKIKPKNKLVVRSFSRCHFCSSGSIFGTTKCLPFSSTFISTLPSFTTNDNAKMFSIVWENDILIRTKYSNLACFCFHKMLNMLAIFLYVSDFSSSEDSFTASSRVLSLGLVYFLCTIDF